MEANAAYKQKGIFCTAQSQQRILHQNNMNKRNIPLYLLASANIIYAVWHGFSWLTWLAIALAAVVFIWDTWNWVRRKEWKNKQS